MKKRIELLVPCGNKDAFYAAVKNGADNVDKVAEVTGAGSACGRCKKLVQNVIDLGR